MLTKIIKACKVTKKLYFSQQCSQIIGRTTNTIEKVAAITFGPYGRNVLIQNQMQQPRITKDGVTVVKHIEFENRFQDAIATLVKKSVDGTNKFAGDGTTTSTILISEIMRIAYRKISAGESIRQIRKGFEIGREICLSFLDSASRKISTEKEIYDIVMIAANKNKQLSELISSAVSKAENIKVEKSQKQTNYIEYYSGVSIVRGLQSQEFANQNNGNLVYNYPLIITSKIPLKNVKQVVKCLQMAKKARKQLLVFASEISDSVMSTFIYNNKKKIVEVCGIRVPLYGDEGIRSLQRVANATNSYTFDEYSEHKIQNIDWDHFGKAIKVEVDKLQTKIEGKTEQKQNQSAIIFVGGSTQTVMLENYDKIIDALNSAKSAKKNGIVAGGGITFWKMAQLLETYQGQGKQGVRIIAEALKIPRKKLMQYINPEKKPLSGQNWEGYDINQQKIVDMFQAGIIDSVNVAKSTIIDSLSLCSMLIEVRVAVARKQANIDNISLKELNKKYSI